MAAQEDDESVASGTIEDQGYYTRYVPVWSTPGRFTLDRRPATEPGDHLKNPTEYALRFGIDSQAPFDKGRSMLTPPLFRGIEDWTSDWQRTIFRGYTSQELEDQGTLDPDMTNAPLHGWQSEDLDTDLHPILGREKWFRDSTYGWHPTFPELRFHDPSSLTDIEWTMEEDLIWTAMQPVLKLVTNVIRSRHPFWCALLSIYHLQPVDLDRLPFARDQYPSFTRWTDLATLWPEIDETKMFPEARSLKALGFDAAGIAEYMLERYVWFSFYDPTAQVPEPGTNGVTVLRRMDGEGEANPTHRIEIKLSAQLVWPLLKRQGTILEKNACSVALASLTLHELGHAAKLSYRIMSCPGWNHDTELAGYHSDLTQLPQNTLDLLLESGRRFFGPEEIMAGDLIINVSNTFFGDENLAEEGWALESQVWGGIFGWMTRLTRTTPFDPGFPDMVLGIMNWPYQAVGTEIHPQEPSEAVDHNHFPWLLTYPPLRPVDKMTAVPLAIINQFFTQAFWANGPATKYGHQALKVLKHMDQLPLKPVFRTPSPSREDYEDVFFIVPDMYRVMAIGERALKRQEDLRWRVVGEYLNSLTDRFVESRIMLRRLRNERRTWPAIDHEIQRLAADMQNIGGEAMAHLDNYRARWSSHALDTYLDQVGLLFTAASKVQLRLEREGRSLEHLLVEFVKQDDGARANMANEHMAPLVVRMRDVFRQTLEQARAIVLQHDGQVRRVETNLPREANAALLGHCNDLTAMNRSMMQKFIATERLLVDVEELFEDSSTDIQAAMPRLNSIAASAGFGEMRKYRLRLQSLALRQMRGMSPDEEVYGPVTSWLRVLELLHQVRNVPVGAAS